MASPGSGPEQARRAPMPGSCRRSPMPHRRPPDRLAARELCPGAHLRLRRECLRRQHRRSPRRHLRRPLRRRRALRRAARLPPASPSVPPSKPCSAAAHGSRLGPASTAPLTAPAKAPSCPPSAPPLATVSWESSCWGEIGWSRIQPLMNELVNSPFSSLRQSISKAGSRRCSPDPRSALSGSPRDHRGRGGRASPDCCREASA